MKDFEKFINIKSKYVKIAYKNNLTFEELMAIFTLKAKELKMNEMVQIILDGYGGEINSIKVKVTTISNSLVKKGFAIKKKNINDKRITLIKLSQKGLDLLK
ncbi:MAG: hypothetical protein K4H23_00065 [Mollicutes bacterium PWAP]|nr:hypothetical protein [Mollicutes bacterium PWAP]